MYSTESALMCGHYHFKEIKDYEHNRCTKLSLYIKEVKKMREYLIVKIGKTHAIDGEIFEQELFELYPLDRFHYNGVFADSIYTYIKGIDPDLTGAFPILAFDNGHYAGCVAVLAIKPDGDGESVILSISREVRAIADAYCKHAYQKPMSRIRKWNKLINVIEKHDLFNEVAEFVNLQIGSD